METPLPTPVRVGDLYVHMKQTGMGMRVMGIFLGCGAQANTGLLLIGQGEISKARRVMMMMMMMV